MNGAGFPFATVPRVIWSLVTLSMPAVMLEGKLTWDISSGTDGPFNDERCPGGKCLEARRGSGCGQDYALERGLATSWYKTGPAPGGRMRPVAIPISRHAWDSGL